MSERYSPAIVERLSAADIGRSRAVEHSDVERAMADRRSLGWMGILLGFVALFVAVTAVVTVRHQMNDVRAADQATVSILAIPSAISAPASFDIAAR